MPTEVKFFDLADYIILYLNAEGLDSEVQRVHRLLYYMQAWHLVFFEKHPLFKEVPEAWGSGPVYPIFFEKYDEGYYGDTPLKPELPAGIDLKEATREKLQSLHLEENQSRFIHAMLNTYGRFEFGWLGILTYSESPWLKARAGLGIVGGGRKITFRSMYAHFHGGKVRREKLAEKERKAQERKNTKKLKPIKIDSNG